MGPARQSIGREGNRVEHRCKAREDASLQVEHPITTIGPLAVTRNHEKVTVCGGVTAQGRQAEIRTTGAYLLFETEIYNSMMGCQPD